MELKAWDDGGIGLDATITFNATVGSGEVDLHDQGDADFHAVAPSTSWARLKVNEADYFLKLSRAFSSHEAALHYNVGAFATAVCGFLDVLTNECRSHEKFGGVVKPWIALRRRRVENDASYATLRQFRNRMVHTGQDPPTLDIRLTFQQHLDGQRTLSQAVTIDRVGRDGPRDPFTIMENTLQIIRDVLAAAERRGFLPQRKRAGHTVTIDCQEEVEPAEWRPRAPDEMAMFGHKMPDILFGAFKKADERSGNDA